MDSNSLDLKKFSIPDVLHPVTHQPLSSAEKGPHMTKVRLAKNKRKPREKGSLLEVPSFTGDAPLTTQYPTSSDSDTPFTPQSSVYSPGSLYIPSDSPPSPELYPSRDRYIHGMIADKRLHPLLLQVLLGNYDSIPETEWSVYVVGQFPLVLGIRLYHGPRHRLFDLFKLLFPSIGIALKTFMVRTLSIVQPRNRTDLCPICLTYDKYQRKLKEQQSRKSIMTSVQSGEEEGTEQHPSLSPTKASPPPPTTEDSTVLPSYVIHQDEESDSDGEAQVPHSSSNSSLLSYRKLKRLAQQQPYQLYLQSAEVSPESDDEKLRAATSKQHFPSPLTAGADDDDDDNPVDPELLRLLDDDTITSTTTSPSAAPESPIPRSETVPPAEEELPINTSRPRRAAAQRFQLLLDENFTRKPRQRKKLPEPPTPEETDPTTSAPDPTEVVVDSASIPNEPTEIRFQQDQDFEQLYALHKHEYTTQRKVMSDTLHNLQPGQVMIFMDYKENFKLPFVWDQGRDDFFKRSQVTCLTFISYYKRKPKDGKPSPLEKTVYSCLSLHLSHTGTFSIHCLKIFLEQCGFEDIDDVFFWSDGGPHFRCSEVLAHIFDTGFNGLEMSKFHVNFFCPCHGKSEVDGCFGLFMQLLKEPLEKEEIYTIEKLQKYLAGRCNEFNLCTDSYILNYRFQMFVFTLRN